MSVSLSLQRIPSLLRLFNSSSTRRRWYRPFKSPRESKKEVARKNIDANPDVLKVAIDCGSQQYYHMTEKERNSFAKQICHGYGYNMHSPLPCKLHLVGVTPDGALETTLRKKFPGYGVARSLLMEVLAEPLLDVFLQRDIIYLTPSSPAVLDEVDSKKVYVIGGIVDDIVEKNLSENVAKRMGLETARLPIKEHMKAASVNPGSLDLPINHVLQIILAVWQGATWPTALQAHMAKRKHWIPMATNL